MTPHESTRRKPLRLWPGVAAALLALLTRAVVPFLGPAADGLGMLVGFGAAVVIILWWMFFSRARWSERLAVVAVVTVVMFATRPFLHQSILGGMMGMMFFGYGIQGISIALVAWAVVSGRLSDGGRRVSLVAAILLASGAWTLLRTDGIIGGSAQLKWRWTPTAEEKLLAQAPEETTAPAPAPVQTPAVTPAPRTAAAVTAEVVAARRDPEWPGFRGPARDSVVHGVRIDTDWTKSPPVALWHKPIGPGWSSFAVAGNLLYTQEQRGDDELVSCYDMKTGKPVWRHRDATRFWESNGGAGPRGTPALSNGRVYALGATGILNALDAATGAVVWSRNAATDTGVKVPGWGFSGSPLVKDDDVVVAVSGRLAGYDVANGTPRWQGPKHATSYSSPHLVTIGGVTQVLFLSPAGAISVAPADGKVLWEHAWESNGATIVQPAMTADGDVLINSIAITGGLGIRRLAVASTPGGWTVNERWTSNGLKPYFNDFVVHNGHAFGFDGNILACIDLADGKRKWKGGRYGNGQLLLLADQDVLLVVSEDGELALVSATPDEFKELARVPAIEGKTWNHPVVIGDVLLVRNGEAMAAFKLALQGR